MVDAMCFGAHLTLRGETMDNEMNGMRMWHYLGLQS